MHDLVLIVPDKPDEERDAVAWAWERRGGSVLRLARFWDPPELDRHRVRLYGPDTFGLVLAEKLQLDLASPEDRLLSQAPFELLRRRVELTRLDHVHAHRLPAFVKPAVPKQFRGAVYGTLQSLEQETRGLGPETEVLVSDVVDLAAEARAFLLDGTVRACSIYEGAGDVAAAATAAKLAAATLPLPRTCVVDVGLVLGGWVVIEFNASWGAGLNGCEAAQVVDCIEAACRVRTGPAAG